MRYRIGVTVGASYYLIAKASLSAAVYSGEYLPDFVRTLIGLPSVFDTLVIHPILDLFFPSWMGEEWFPEPEHPLAIIVACLLGAAICAIAGMLVEVVVRLAVAEFRRFRPR